MFSTLNYLIFKLHNIIQFAFDELNVFFLFSIFCVSLFILFILFKLAYLLNSTKSITLFFFMLEKYLGEQRRNTALSSNG